MEQHSGFRFYQKFMTFHPVLSFLGSTVCFRLWYSSLKTTLYPVYYHDHLSIVRIDSSHDGDDGTPAEIREVLFRNKLFRQAKETAKVVQNNGPTEMWPHIMARLGSSQHGEGTPLFAYLRAGTHVVAGIAAGSRKCKT